MAARVGGNLVASFVLSVVLLAILGVVSFRAVNTLIANNERVTHTQEVLEELQTVRTLLIQVETDARGFLLTGGDVYLQAYQQDLEEIPRQISSLREKTRDNLSHQERFSVLESAVASRLELLQQYVDRREVLGVTVIPPGQGPEGKRRMDAVRAALDDVRNAESILLEERLEESRQSTQQLLVTLILAFLGSLALVCAVFYLARRDIRVRQLNEEKLAAARDALEERVRERTAELGTTNLELERSNRELQDFAFVASHDLQEPLRKIQAFGDRLRTVQADKFDDQGRDYLERMHNAAGRMHVLINDLLSFSRVTTKAQPFIPTDLSVIVTEVLSDLEIRIQQTDATVNVGDLPTIDADPLQMRQLFQNLIGNALKFYREGVAPQIEVTSELTTQDEGRGRCEIKISDNGIGFEEKYLDRIFTPFQRLHGRNEYEGTGIGLAICRKIVERHGGELTATSKVGEGTTFIVTMPTTAEKGE